MTDDRIVSRDRSYFNRIKILLAISFAFDVEPSLAQAFDPFSAIAAGDMTSTSAVLWTQLRNGTGTTQLSGAATPLSVEVSTDSTFATTSFSATGVTMPENGNALKLLVGSLSPNTQYFYRFNNNGTYSDTGTFFTNPASRQITPFKMGFSGDYDAQYRPYTVMNGFGTNANPGSVGLRYFINLGDIIYERDATGSPRLPNLSPSSSAADNQNALNDFYRKYIEDVTGVNSVNGSMNTSTGQQGIKQLLSSTAVYTLLDNHELYNAMISGGAPQNSEKENYLCGDTTPGFVPSSGDPCLTSASNNAPGATYINKTTTFNNMEKAFFNTQATAAQIDGLPTTGMSINNLINSNPTVIAPSDPRSNGTPQNFLARDWGGAARYIQLDDRSYRDARMYNTTPLIADDPNRTMLGMTQLDWFKQQLSKAQQEGVVWKVVSISTPIDVWLTPDNQLDNKSWIAGYNAERNDIMKYVEDNKISNVLFLTTDDHIARATRLTYQPAGASGSNAWSTMSSAFQLLAGPAGAVGPYENYLDYGTSNGVVTTGFGIGTTEKLINEKNPYVQANGGAPVGLMGLPGLNNVYREQDANSAANPTSKDFVSATSFGYTTLAWDRFANLSVEYLGIDAYDKNTYPATSAIPRLLFGFSVDVPYTIESGQIVSLSDLDRHQFTGRSPDPLFFNSSWTNNGVLDISSTITGAGFANYQGNGSLIVSANTPLKISETAALHGGTVVANVAYGEAASLTKSSWTAIRAGNGVNGRFNDVSFASNLSFLTPNLNYGLTEVTLSFALTPFSVVGRTINQRNVGNALTIGAYGPITGPGANLLNTLLYGTYQNAQSLMNTVGGAGLAGVQTSAMEIGQMASSAVSDQIAFWRSGEAHDTTGFTSREGGSDYARGLMAYAPTEPGGTSKTTSASKGRLVNHDSLSPTSRTFRAWGSMYGGAANFNIDVSRGAPSANLNYYGGLLGVDYQVSPNALVGVALGGSTAGFGVSALSTSGNLTGFNVGLYGSYALGASYIALNETFSAYSNQTNRSAGGYLFLPYEKLSASFGSTEFRTRLEGGHSVQIGGLTATPFLAAEFAAYQSNAFTEQSSLFWQSSLMLRNNGQSINSVPTFVGLRLSNSYTLGNGWRFAPVGSLAYVHEFSPNRQLTNMLLSIPGPDFNVSGPRSTYNLVQAKIGAQLYLNNQFALFTDFQGEFSSASQSYGGKGGFRYYW